MENGTTTVSRLARPRRRPSTRDLSRERVLSKPGFRGALAVHLTWRLGLGAGADGLNRLLDGAKRREAINMEERVHDRDVHGDHVQHGIDNNPQNDPQKGAAIGGIGGAVVGAAAGAATGPVGAVIGAVIGGVAGAAASGAAVAAVDKMDDDDTLTGIGDHHTDIDADDYAARSAYTPGTTGTTDTTYTSGQYGASAGAIGTDVHNTMDRMGYGTRPGDVNMGEGTSDAGLRTAYTSDTIEEPTTRGLASDRSFESGLGNDVPGVQTGGRAIDGTPDTRGVTEKVADAVTGDHVDDKTGKIV